MGNNIATIFSFILVSCALAVPASALPINVGGINYEVTTVYGTPDELASVLEATPWYGDEGQALAFAMAVGDSLDYPNFWSEYSLEGPYFTHNLLPSDEAPLYTISNEYALCGLYDLQYTCELQSYSQATVGDNNFDWTFAVAERVGKEISAVPAPVGIWLLGSGLIGLVGFQSRQRI